MVASDGEAVAQTSQNKTGAARIARIDIAPHERTSVVEFP
jgi:hypothetical protein